MDLGDVLVMPSTARDQRTDYRSLMDKQSEKASPGYYSVELTETGVKAELTATPHVAFHRYTFHRADSAALYVDLQHGPVWNESMYRSHVKACEVKPGATYRAILVPQQAALTVTVTTDDGRSHTKTLSSAQLESGRRYDMSVLVTNEEIQISLSGDIGDWEDGGSLDGSGGGDGGDDDSQTLSYGGVTYRTTTVGETVWMAENLRYVPDEALLTKGIWYPDGNEDAEYVREHGMLYSFTAALGGAQAVSGAPVRGICPAGWHVPYIDELQTLAAGPDFGFTLAGMWNSVSNNYVSSAKSGYLMSATTDDGGSSYSVLLFYASGGNPAISPQTAANGVSLRCVKDAK